MGLATVIRREKAKEGLLRLLVLGLDGAGKSSVVSRWCGGETDEIRHVAPTFGFRIWTVRDRLHIWDVGGQQVLRHYWKNYFESTEGLVFVIDAAAPARLAESVNELGRLIGGAPGEGPGSRISSFTVLILANKCDCEGSLSPDQIEAVVRPLFDPKDASCFAADSLHWRVFPCSALTQFNTEESLQWLVDDVDQRLGYRRVPPSPASGPPASPSGP